MSGLVLGTEICSFYAGWGGELFVPTAALFAGSLVVMGICLIYLFRFAIKDLIYLAIFFGTCIFCGLVLASNVLATGYLLILMLGTLIASGLFTWRKLGNTIRVRSGA